MASETKIGVAGDEHLLVHRPVRVVTRGAAFAHRFVLENKRPALRSMAFAACVVLGQQCCSAAPHCRALVRVMAIAAGHLATQHWMTVGELELPFLVQMTLEAGIGRSVGIQDGVARAAGLIVNASCAVARFATDVFGIRSVRLDACVRRRLESAHNLGMTLRASLRANIFGIGDLWWSENRALRRRAGDQANRHNQRAQTGHDNPAAATQNRTTGS